ncbi:MAG: hypothetical protein JJ913_13620 [Rhizobiaceae bacterium]|nr:hypothetical protein [Rhizobiaceae bacterium]
MRILHALAVAALALGAGQVHAAEMRVIETPSAIRSVVATPAGRFVTLRDGSSHRLSRCDGKVICLMPAPVVGLPVKAPEGSLPGGRVATAPSGDIRRAWYARPTTRYGHGVLGDAVEAGSLIAEDAAGQHFEHVLENTHVFEDITPRIADLDGDGRNEIVAIRSSLQRGAAVAVLGLRAGALALLDATPEIGRSNRWLNVAGLADYTGAGVPVIAWVETPHIGGILKMAAFENGRLNVFANTYSGFSNHVIGSRELGLAATGDFTGDGVPDLALPNANRRSIVIAARTGFEKVPLLAPVTHGVVDVDGIVVTATSDGALVAVIP